MRAPCSVSGHCQNLFLVNNRIIHSNSQPLEHNKMIGRQNETRERREKNMGRAERREDGRERQKEAAAQGAEMHGGPEGEGGQRSWGP